MVKPSMTGRILLSLACTSGLLGMLLILFLPENLALLPISRPGLTETLAPRELEQIAQRISVRVLGTEPLGTGILIGKTGTVYTVLTNDHVLRSGTSPYQIETADGQRYPAIGKMRGQDLADHDLALLEFDSKGADYQIAKLGKHRASGERVLAAGFPWEEESDASPQGLVLRQGQVWRVLEKALEGGYQIGYSNEITKGMSGGPLLNQRGEVIAIHGMHAYPLWGDPYIYQDGSQPDSALREQMTHYSWGIPIATFRKLTRH